MQKTIVTGIIASIRVGTKGASISLTNGTQIPVGLPLLPSLAISAGVGSTALLPLFAVGAKLTATKLDVKAGDSLGNDRQGKPIINKKTNTNFYSTDHTRYQEISIELHPSKLEAAANAVTKIAIAREEREMSMFASGASLPKAPVESLEDDETPSVAAPATAPAMDENLGG